jgi:hypothetical protein
MGSKSIPNPLRIPYALISDETPHRRSVRVVFLFVFSIPVCSENQGEANLEKKIKNSKSQIIMKMKSEIN